MTELPAGKKVLKLVSLKALMHLASVSMMKKPNCFLFYFTLHYGLLREAAKMPAACCSHSPDAPGWFEADVVARGLVVLADGAAHDQAHRQRGVDPLLAGARLDEVGASHHAHQRALRHRGVCCVLQLSTDIRVFKVSQWQEKAPPC